VWTNSNIRRPSNCRHEPGQLNWRGCLVRRAWTPTRAPERSDGQTSSSCSPRIAIRNSTTRLPILSPRAAPCTPAWPSSAAARTARTPAWPYPAAPTSASPTHSPKLADLVPSPRPVPELARYARSRPNEPAAPRPSPPRPRRVRHWACRLPEAALPGGAAAAVRVRGRPPRRRWQGRRRRRLAARATRHAKQACLLTAWTARLLILAAPDQLADCDLERVKPRSCWCRNRRRTAQSLSALPVAA
jgi:hypothetical protein